MYTHTHIYIYNIFLSVCGTKCSEYIFVSLFILNIITLSELLFTL